MNLSRASEVLTQRSAAIFFLGISSGIPYLLIFGTLSVWLAEAGIERSTIGFISWATLAYAFKFIWAPLVDNLPLPFFTQRFGRRRGWILFAQILVLGSLLWMSLWDPVANQSSLGLLVAGTVALAFCAATQDIAIDAYRIDIATHEQQALLSGMIVPGFRVGMILAGAGMFEIVSFLGTEDEYIASAWQLAYKCMAFAMLIGVVTTLIIPEPEISNEASPSKNPLRLLTHFVLVASAFVLVFYFVGQMEGLQVAEHSPLVEFLAQVIRLVAALGVGIVLGWVLCRIRLLDRSEFHQVYVSPFSEFFGRFGSLAITLLLVICFYRTSDIVMGVMAKVFYVDIGYTTKEIGRITFVFGTFMTLLGGVIGGLLALRFGVIKMLLVGATCSALSNLIFVGLANQVSPSAIFLTLAIIADNLSGGLAMAVGVAFLSSLTAKKFSATQYAAFFSVTVLLPSLIAGYSGSMIEAIGYGWFFSLTALMGIPVLVLICLIWKPYNELVES